MINTTPKHISYDKVCEIARSDPNNAYFEFEENPAKIKPISGKARKKQKKSKSKFKETIFLCEKGIKKNKKKEPKKTIIGPKK